MKAGRPGSGSGQGQGGRITPGAPGCHQAGRSPGPAGPWSPVSSWALLGRVAGKMARGLARLLDQFLPYQPVCTLPGGKLYRLGAGGRQSLVGPLVSGAGFDRPPPCATTTTADDAWFEMPSNESGFDPFSDYDSSGMPI